MSSGPVLILFGFPLFISLNLSGIWVRAVLSPMVDALAATVFPLYVVADTEITLSDSRCQVREEFSAD